MSFTETKISEINVEIGMNVRLLLVSVWVCPPCLERCKYSNLLFKFGGVSLSLRLEVVKCRHE